MAVTSLTFEEIKIRVGKNLKRYVDGAWKASPADVTEEDVEELINEIYLEELAPRFINKFEEDFRVVSHVDSWIATDTASAASTGNTLISTNPIFTNSMVGLFIRNTTDNETTQITAYNSSTSVVVQADINNTWDGDTIYVLGQEFSFGGDATNTYQLESIGVKFKDTDLYYRKARLMDKSSVFYSGWESRTQTSPAAPIAYLTSLNINDVLTNGVGILPGFQYKVDNAIEVNRLIRPPALVNPGDKPNLPVASALIAGATKRGFQLKQEFTKANIWKQEYKERTAESLSSYVPNRFKYTSGIKASRRVVGMFNRRF